MTPTFHSLTIAGVRRETEDAVSVAFTVPPELRDAYRFEHGQYLTLRATLGGEEVRRSYSICSGCDDGELRVAVKRVPGGLFSAYANEALRPGMRIEVMTPMGRFTTPLDPAARRTYVALAAGSGITPVLSIVKTVLAREPLSQVILVYGNRTVSSILFRQELDDLKDRHLGRLAVHHVLSREPDEAGLLPGRIDAALVETLCRTLVEPAGVHAWFLCGPQAMVETVRTALTAAGTEPGRIHVELFSAGPDSARGAARPAATTHISDGEGAAAVTVLQDGKRREFLLPYEADSILDAAHRAGADLPYSCKSGVCSTCRAKLVEGEVAMAQNYALEPWEVEAGYILTCQSRPLTPRVTIDFDAT